MLQRNWLDRFFRTTDFQSGDRRDGLEVRRTSGAQHSCHKRRRQAGCLSHFSSESLEVRQVMAATPIAGLSDEFTNAASINDWSEINHVEGWGPRGAQLNQWTVNANGDGRMVMQPHSVVWYEDWRGPLVFKEVTGDFVVTTKMRVTDRDDVGGSDADDVPGDSQFSLGGLMIRTPRAISNGAADWVPGSRNDVGNVGENYVFLSMGYATGTNRYSFEVKTTRNSTSNLELTPLGLTPNEVELRIARIGSTVVVLHRLDGEANWSVHRRYSRPDMPQTLQVGMVTYSDWEKANDLAPVVHNGAVIAPGQFSDPTPFQPFNPDLTASFDYTRFDRPQVPAELAGVNLLTATDNQLLSFLGQGGDANPEPPKVTRIGMNAGGVVDWDPGMMFRDAFQRARPWGTQAQNVATGDRTWQFLTGEGPTLAVDQHGWVTSLPQWQHSDGTVNQQIATTVLFTDEARQPAGIYRAEWTGNGNLEMPFVTESGTMPDGRHYAMVNMPFGVHFAMQITSTDPANPIRDIHLWMPDYNGQSLVGEWHPGEAGSPFHPLFVDRLDEFDTLRFMDLMTTNRTDVVTWDDRPKLTDASQSDGDLLEYFHTHGVAPEYLIELSNETGANPWFNMPYQANDDYVRQFATLVRDTLDPDLKVYVEWSNEVWNGFFPTYHWVAAQTQLLENAGLDFFAIAGREMRRDFDIWSDVFSGQEDRLVRVVAGQQANVWLTEQFLANVAGRVDAVSATAYAGIGSEQVASFNPVTTTADDIIDSLLNVSIPWASARLREHESLVKTYEGILGRDLEFVTYESGSHVMSDPNPFFGTELADEALEAQNSPRMYDVYQTLLGAVNDAGVDLYNEFSFTSHASVRPFGSYGVLHDMTTPLSEAHKLRSLYDYIAATAPANASPVLGTLADQSINEGSTLNFVASATDADVGQTLTYSLGEDAPEGMTINAQTGAVSWTPSDAEGEDVFLVTIIATDNGNPALGDETTVAITVQNIAPTASISGPTEVMRGQAVQFTLQANDPSAADQAAGFTFDIDWNGDGTVDQTVVGPSGMTVNRSFDVTGTYNIIVTATDKDDATSTPAQHSVRAISTGLITDPVDATRTALQILGTGSNDVIQVLTTAIAGRLQVKLNGRIAGAFSPTGRILINGFAGNDSIQLDSRITLPAEIDGGNGNDTIVGAGGNDILLGGAGDDSINGSGGRDILIGGAGRDSINGGSGEDILIGGTTTHQTGALRNVMAEWVSGSSYSTRVANLSRTGTGTLVLNPATTVGDDAAIDNIWGAGNSDWIFARLDGLNRDVLRDRISSEVVTPV